MGKLPFFEFEDGTTLSESQVMLEYAERAVLADLPVRDYLALVNQRPAAQKVNADRKAWQEQVKQQHQPRTTKVSRHGFAGSSLAAA